MCSGADGQEFGSPHLHFKSRLLAKMPDQALKAFYFGFFQSKRAYPNHFDLGRRVWVSETRGD